MIKKKVYKKNKRVVETVIFLRKSPKKKINYSRFFILIGLFFITFALYYLNILNIFDNTSSVTMKYISEAISTKQTPQITTPKVASFPVDWQKTLLKQPEDAVSPLPKRIAKAHVGSNQIVWHGPRDTKEIALTFDADMTPVMVDWLHDGQVQSYDDKRITDYLIQHNIRATFFLTGLWIESYPDATKQLADNSLFELENHTYSHPSMVGDCFDQPQVPATQYPFEIEKTQQLIERYTHQVPQYFRFPGGCYDQADLDLVKKEGLITVHWDDVGDDGFNNNEEQIINNVLSEANPGGIIVLHMGSPASNVPQTANALPIIIDGLEKRGFQFVTVSELLNPPKAVAQITPTQYLTSLKSFQTLSP